MKKKIEVEFDNARRGKWSYNVFYGLDFAGKITGDEVKVSINLHLDIPEEDVEGLINKVATDLEISRNEIEI